MKEKPLAALLTAAFAAPLCALCVLGPAALGAAFAWIGARIGGLEPWALALASAGAVGSVHALRRWRRHARKARSGPLAISAPMSLSKQGLPIGVQFVGRDCDEATLIRIAAQVEKARPWIDRKPQVMS